MHENKLQNRPQWAPVTFAVDDLEVTLKVKCLMAMMLQFQPEHRIPIEDVEKQTQMLLGTSH